MHEIMDMDVYEKYLSNIKRDIRSLKIKSMCKTLDKLAGKSPEELLSGANISNQLPVNLELLLKHWTVSALPINFSELEAYKELQDNDEIKNKKILGAVVLKGDSLCIFYDSTDTPHRQRFTIAHELAHCCLDYENLKERKINFRIEYADMSIEHSGDEYENEKKMNTFAGELLIPEKILRMVYERFHYVEELSVAFAVSINVMTERLKTLGLVAKSNSSTD